MGDDAPFGHIGLGFGQGLLLVCRQRFVVKGSFLDRPEAGRGLCLEELDKPKRRVHLVFGQGIDEGVKTFPFRHASKDTSPRFQGRASRSECRPDTLAGEDTARGDIPHAPGTRSVPPNRSRILRGEARSHAARAVFCAREPYSQVRASFPKERTSFPRRTPHPLRMRLRFPGDEPRTCAYGVRSRWGTSPQRVYRPLAQRTAASNRDQPSAVRLVAPVSARKKPTRRAGAARPTIAAPLS